MGAGKKDDAALVAAVLEQCGGFCASWFWGGSLHEQLELTKSPEPDRRDALLGSIRMDSVDAAW